MSILQDIRKEKVGRNTLEFLRSKCQRPLPPNEFGIRPTILHSRNADVSRENLAELQQLKGETKIYEAMDTISKERGAPDWAENQLWKSQFFSNCIADKELPLKIGAQVMLIKNEGRQIEYNSNNLNLVNGSRGTVVGFRRAPPSKSEPALPGVEMYPVVQFVNGIKKQILPTSFVD